MSDLLNQVNWVDLLVLILLLKIGYISSRIGVGKQILPLGLLLCLSYLSLYSYHIIGELFIQRGTFTPSVCIFLGYILAASPFFVIYNVFLRVMPIVLPGGDVAGGIEKTGGALIGVLRSVIIIGILLTGLLLVPVRAVENSVKYSYTGLYFIRINAQIYVALRNKLLKNNQITLAGVLADLNEEKSNYYFERDNVKTKANFYKKKDF